MEARGCGLRGIGVRGSDILRAVLLEDYPAKVEAALEVEAGRMIRHGCQYSGKRQQES